MYVNKLCQTKKQLVNHIEYVFERKQLQDKSTIIIEFNEQYELLKPRFGMILFINIKP